MEVATYVLGSTESEQFSQVRKCQFLERKLIDGKHECAVIKVSPGVDGQAWGIPGENDVFVLTNRHAGESLFPVSDFPCCVHIARITSKNPDGQENILSSSLEVVAWGELHRSLAEANYYSSGDVVPEEAGGTL